MKKTFEDILKKLPLKLTKKQAIWCGIIILSIITICIGVSYAYWKISFTQKDFNTLGVKCFDVTLTNEKNNIQLGNAMPITDDEGLGLEPYTFTITNTCDTYAYYQVNLEDINDSEIQKRLNYKYLKASLDGGTPQNLSLYQEAVPTIDNADKSFQLTSGTLAPSGSEGDSKSYALRLWMDYDTPLLEETMSATFESKISVVASYIEEEKLENTIILSYESKTQGYTKDKEEIEITAKSEKYNLIEYSEDGITFHPLKPDKTITAQKEYSEESTKEFYVKDEVGNVEKIEIELQHLDQTGPNIIATASDSWGVTNKIHINLEDKKSGLAGYQITTENKTPEEWKEVTGASATVEENVSQNGTYYIFAKDQLGNITSQTVQVNKIDFTAPIIKSLTEQENFGKTSIVTAVVQDTESGIAGYQFTTEEKEPTDWVTVETTTEEQSYTYEANKKGTIYFYVKDATGHITHQSINVTKVDLTGPSITATASDSWATTNTITIQLADNESGLAGYQITTENKTPENWKEVTGSTTTVKETVSQNGTYYIFAKDQLGNITSQSVQVNKVDLNAPVIKSLTEQTNFGKISIVTAVTQDTESGIVGYQFTTEEKEPTDWVTVETTTEEQSYTYEANKKGTIYFYVKDATGQISHKSIDVTKVDQTGPSITATASNSWASTNTISIQLTDNESGLAGYQISTTDQQPSEWKAVSGTSKSVQETVSKNGTYYIFAKDSAGNVSSKSVNVTKVDLTAPVIKSLTEQASYGKTSVVTAVAQDTESGIVGYQFTTEEANPQEWITVSVTTEEQTYKYEANKKGMVYFYVKDGSGKISHQSINVTKVDLTGPSITATASNAWASTNTVTIQLTDNESGLAGYQISTTNQQPSEWKNISGTSKSVQETVSKNGTYYIFAKDTLGNVSSKSVNVTKVDLTAPSIKSLTEQTSFGKTSIVTAVAQDTESGIVGYQFTTTETEPTNWVSVTATTKEQTYTYEANKKGMVYFYVKDGSGKISHQSINVTKVDLTGPSITASASTSWATTNTVTIQLTDNESGLAGYQITTENKTPEDWKTVTGATTTVKETVSKNGTYYVFAKDALGNVSSKSVSVTKVDLTAPSIKSLTEQANYGKTSIVTAVTQDTESGIVGYQFTTEEKEPTDWISVTATTNEQTYTHEANKKGMVYFYVKDATGHVSHKSINVTKVDSTGPSITATASTSWASTNTLTIQLTDNESGLAGYQITTENKTPEDWKTVTGATTTVKETVSKNGTYYVFAKDSAGNVSSKSVNVTKVDLTAPSIKSLTEQTSFGKTSVVTAVAQDTESGIVGYQFTTEEKEPTSWVNVTATTEEQSYTYNASKKGMVYFYVKDGSGKISHKGVNVTKVDLTGPSITATASTSWASTNTVTIQLSDNESGLAAYNITTTNQQPSEWKDISGTSKSVQETVSKNGTYYIFAKDKVGNVSSKSVTVTKVDLTAPVIKSLTEQTSFGKTSVVTAVAQDTESGIVGYQFTTTETDPQEWVTVSATTEQQTYTYNATKNGTIYFYVKDASGKISHKSVSVTKVDSTGPSITATASTSWASTNTVTIQLTDNESGLAGYQISTTNQQPSEWKAVSGTSQSVQETVSKNGTYYIFAKDSAGNISSKSVSVTKVDNEGPNVVIKATTGNGTISIDASGSSDAGIGIQQYEYSLDGKTYYPSETSSYTFTNVSHGEHTVYVKVTDKLGNESIKTQTVNVVITYTITFNANGGSGGPSTQTKTHGVNLTLSSTVPTRSNYKFLGWSTDPKADDPMYTAGGTFTTNANTTLYAIWQIASLNTKYNYTGGVQSFTAPSKGVYSFEMYGAGSASGQAGAKLIGRYTLNANQTIYIVIGGKGSSSTGGYNGGGNGGYGGGGATHIATTNRGVLSNYSSYQGEVIAVAAGAGGSGTSATIHSNIYGASFSTTGAVGAGGASGANGGNANNIGVSNNGYKQILGANGGNTNGTGGAAVNASQTYLTGYGSSLTGGTGGGGGGGWTGGGGGSSGSLFGTTGSSSGSSNGITGKAGGNGSFGKGGTGGAAVSCSANGRNSPVTATGGAGGAGGQSYYSKLTSPSLQNGANTSNGSVTVTWVGPAS